MMPSRSTLEAAADGQRAKIYGYLSQAFSYPDQTTLDSFSQLWKMARHLSSDDGEDWNIDSLESLQAAYIATLDGGARRHEQAHPYAGYWMDGERPQTLLDIQAFYRYFGFKLPAGAESPDHISVELAALANLAKSGAQAPDATDSGPDRLGYILAQRDFLSRHVAPWMPKLSAELQEKTQASAYQQLARFAETFVKTDLASLEARVGGTQNPD